MYSINLLYTYVLFLILYKAYCCLCILCIKGFFYFKDSLITIVHAWNQTTHVTGFLTLNVDVLVICSYKPVKFDISRSISRSTFYFSFFFLLQLIYLIRPCGIFDNKR